MSIIYSPERYQSEEVELKDLEPYSEEFQFVGSYFNNSLCNKIVKIQVVYNKGVWNNYLDHYFKLLSGSHVEVFVFHGTRLNDPHLIYTQGLKYEKSIKGLYFAKDSVTSNSFAHRSGAVYQIFMCRALVPYRDFNSSVHVITNNNDHYPQYLISYN
ncbi:hypothetical protein ACTA71_006969 [Dictyostelium dimigraforme]